MYNHKIFRNDIVCMFYHLSKILFQIMVCIMFAPYDFQQWTLYNNYLLYFLIV